MNRADNILGIRYETCQMTIRRLTKMNDSLERKLGGLKTQCKILENGYLRMDARMSSHKEEINERDQGIAELQIDNEGLKQHNEELLKASVANEELILELQKTNNKQKEDLNKLTAQKMKKSKEIKRLQNFKRKSLKRKNSKKKHSKR